MTNTIKCPDCGKEIEIDKVLTHQIEEQVIGELQMKNLLEELVN
jgi:hypothetical protein